MSQTECRFCSSPTDTISNSCAECRRMKGKMSDKAFLAQVLRIATHLHQKRLTKGVDRELLRG